MNWKFWQKDKTQPKVKKSPLREWADAVVFAVIAATLIRGLFVEPYVIPTGSMEKTLLVGDFLFVSKMSYGARTPMTPVSFPFVHNTLPLVGGKSYIKGIQLKYHRLPGFGDVQRNDVVVFNYPMEADSPLYHPVDKRENYIKRCVAIAGDTIEIKNRLLYVNRKPSDAPINSQTSYLLETNGEDFNPVQVSKMRIEGERIGERDYIFHMTKEEANQVAHFSNTEKLSPVTQRPNEWNSDVYPHNYHFKWNEDNFGPLIIPKKGWTITLDSNTVALYRRAIEIYEGKKMEMKDRKYFIDGKETKSYTFDMNYYWMMGDNRHNSLDSRYWGFVPEDHVVGKALFVWMSWDNQASFFSKIRWKRLFMKIK